MLDVCCADYEILSIPGGNSNRAQKFAEFLIATFGIEALCGKAAANGMRARVDVWGVHDFA